MKGFKVRLAVALVVIAALSWIYQGNTPIKHDLQPVLEYTATRDYDIIGWGTRMWAGLNPERTAAVSASGFQLPCAYTGIARHFGWYYNPKTNSQIFNPGVFLEIDEDTSIYPVLKGRVSKVTSQENGYQVVIQHGNGLVSMFRGIRDTAIKAGEFVEEDTILGNGSDMVYIEIRSGDSPIDPETFLGKTEEI